MVCNIVNRYRANSVPKVGPLHQVFVLQAQSRAVACQTTMAQR